MLRLIVSEHLRLIIVHLLHGLLSLLISLGTGRLTCTLLVNLLLLLHILQRLVDLLIRALILIDLLDEVRKALDVLACRILHAMVVLFIHDVCTDDLLSLIRAELEIRLGWERLSLQKNLCLRIHR